MCLAERCAECLYPDLHKGTYTQKEIHVNEKDARGTIFFSLRLAFYMFINMIITGLENPHAVRCCHWKCFIFNYDMLCLLQKESVPIVSAFWIGQLLIVSRIGGPSHFECQPYLLSLITPHSMFVYGGNESLTNRGIPLGTVWLHGQWIVMILHLSNIGGFLFPNFGSRYTV